MTDTKNNTSPQAPKTNAYGALPTGPMMPCAPPPVIAMTPTWFAPRRSSPQSNFNVAV